MITHSSPLMPPASAIFFIDFDGTIKPEGDRWVCHDDLEALRAMRTEGWARVVATGRSLFGFAKIWRPDLELDWLIFSSGAGLCAWSQMGPGPLLSGSRFSHAEAEVALLAALKLGYGFFAYGAPPDNHHFHYHLPPDPPVGYLKRLEIFASQSRPWPTTGLTKAIIDSLGQLLIMIPANEIDQAEGEFLRLAPGLSVVRASSPFGDGCLWLEVFPPQISKGQAAAALAQRLGLNQSKCAAMGNDYNDRDLLDWAGHPFITSDAPADMINQPHHQLQDKPRYHITAPAGESGLAQAWRKASQNVADQ